MEQLNRKIIETALGLKIYVFYDEIAESINAVDGITITISANELIKQLSLSPLSVYTIWKK